MTTTTTNTLLWLLLTSTSWENSQAFSMKNHPMMRTSRTTATTAMHSQFLSSHLHVNRRGWISSLPGTKSNNDNESSDDNNKINPYADPNYPDLEFVDYSDPEYTADSGNYDEFYDGYDSTEAEIEAMREERRQKNDEFQFNTYYAKTYQNGATFAGEWTIYKVHWPQKNSNSKQKENVIVPTLSQFKQTFPVTTRLEVDGQGRWVHVEECHSNLMNTSNTNTALDWNTYYKPYWPAAMIPFDFRGQQGNMVCGDAWTVCQALSAAQESVVEGPFVEYRAEVGLSYGSLMRYRLKLDYSTTTKDDPCLQLQYLTVCREVVVERELHWPRDHPNYEVQEALFGEPGAEGGLYDPPPIAEGTENNYILLDLPGHVTTLIPVVLDPAFSSSKVNWVTSLDWTPGKLRYQVDRKVNTGKDLLGLRSLELSEVQAADAEEYRPRDGGQDMRQ